jgi:hypothetical protein
MYSNLTVKGEKTDIRVFNAFNRTLREYQLPLSTLTLLKKPLLLLLVN